MTNLSISEQESGRLQLSELFQLADELGHRKTQLSKDGHRILDEILARLRALCLSEKTDRLALNEVSRDMQSRWQRIDVRVDDLLSTAADEIAEFATIAESRIGAYERSVRHQKASNMSYEDSDVEEPG